MDPFDKGFLAGVLVGEGSFGGDGRQPAVTLRMHVRHEALFRHLTKLVPGSRLYGPYHHSQRSYYHWVLRGPALRRWLPVLDEIVRPELDGHAWGRYQAMKRDYRLSSQLAQ